MQHQSEIHHIQHEEGWIKSENQARIKELTLPCGAQLSQYGALQTQTTDTISCWHCEQCSSITNLLNREG